MTGDDQVARDGADVLRERLGKALAAREVVRALTVGLPVAGFALLAARLLWPALERSRLLAGFAAVLALCWAAGRFLAARRKPPRAACVAAVDAASRGGGLLMAGAAARRAGWHPPVSSGEAPSVAYRPGRALWPPALMAAFALAVVALPASFLARAVPPARPDGLRALLDEEAQRLARYRAEEVVDEETAGRIEDWLTSAGASEEASAGELLDLLDQVANELDRVGEQAATAADATHNAALAAEELTDRLAQAAETGALGAADLAAAAEALRAFLEQSGLADGATPGLSSDSLSNLLSSAASGALSSEAMRALSEALAACRAASDARLRQLTEADVRSLSRCAGGACTNGAAALAALLSQAADGAACAAALATLCDQGGSGGIGKGYAQSELTWQDPVSTEGTAAREQSLGAGRASGADAPRTVGLSASAPKDEGRAPTAPGALGEAAGAAGHARTPVVLPRHRAAVRRYQGGRQ